MVTRRACAFALCISAVFLLLIIGNKFGPIWLNHPTHIARLVFETLFSLVTLTPIVIYSWLCPSYWWKTITGPVRLKALDVLLLIAPIVFGSLWFHHGVDQAVAHASALVIAFVFSLALVEEIMFRGFILWELQRRFSATTAIVIQSILFALFHLPRFVLFYHTLPSRLLLYLVVDGIVWGLVAWRTRSIWPSTVGHLASNIVLSP